jgi:Tfp pilus assembly protein PilF
MDKNPNKNRFFLICLALAISTFAVFYQVHSFKFINIDDPVYVYRNPNIQSGFTFDSIEWAFTTGYFGNWNPLTWLSYMFDWQFFGSKAAGFHITNLIFHIANTLLLFIVLKQMTNALWRSAFVAALFALHPLHVEPVVWVSCRKDVLSAFFWLLTIWAYLQYIRKPDIFRYLLIVLMYILSLMAKPMLVTLPFLFLLLDYWPLERISRFDWRTIYRLVLEKIPLIVLAAVFSVLAFFTQRNVGALPELADLGLKFRACNAVISYIKYIEKLFWPSRLAVFYPHPGEDVSILFAVISAVILIVMTILILRSAKKHRYLVTGWFWYLGTLVPVIGLVQIGSHAMADRYTYITLSGLFIVIAWGLPELLEKLRYRKIILWVSSLTVLSVLTVLAYLQVQYWKSSITICQHALKVTKGNYAVHAFIAEAFLDDDRVSAAIWHNTEALRINPACAIARNGLGVIFYKMGKIDEAVNHFNKAVDIDPRQKDVYSNLGMAFAAKGKFEQAVSFYHKELQINPDSINTRLNLGAALTSSGKLEQAAKEYEKILSIQPRNAVANNDFGVVLFKQGKLDQAIVHFRQAVKINPQYSDARKNLNSVLAEKQKSQSPENAKE